MTDFVHLDALTAHSYQAWQDNTDLVFVIRETVDGWKSEGHPSDGLLCATRDELIAHLEGRAPR